MSSRRSGRDEHVEVDDEAENAIYDEFERLQETNMRRNPSSSRGKMRTMVERGGHHRHTEESLDELFPQDAAPRVNARRHAGESKSEGHYSSSEEDEDDDYDDDDEDLEVGFGNREERGAQDKRYSARDEQALQNRMEEEARHREHEAMRMAATNNVQSKRKHHQQEQIYETPRSGGVCGCSVCGDRCNCGTRFWLSAVFLTLACSAIALGIVFGMMQAQTTAPENGNVVRTDPSSPATGSNATNLPSNASQRYRDIFKIVVPISGAAALSGFAQTPQRRALSFVADTDRLQLPVNGNDQALIQRYLVVVFYYALGGNIWQEKSQWLQSSDVCQWQFVECSPTFAGGRVARTVRSLRMPNNNLVGTLPPELGRMADLEVLDLHKNKISGSLPSDLGNLTSLKDLYLQENSIRGNIPPSIGNMTNLVSILLNNNNLNGPLQPTIGNLVNLEQLHLYGNQLNGILPSDLGKLQRLKRLWLSGNRFSSQIPSAIGTMSSLEALYLDENFFSGSIPPEIANANQLQDIRLYKNVLTTGGIPDTFRTQLPNLRVLYLDNNYLGGEIPQWISAKANLEHLDLSNNRMTGQLPESLGNLGKLIKLKLADNQFSGSLPRSLINLSNLEVLYLDGNQFQGVIPVFLARLAKLVELKLDENQFSGNVPQALCSRVLSALVVDCIVNCGCCTACTPGGGVVGPGTGGPGTAPSPVVPGVGSGPGFGPVPAPSPATSPISDPLGQELSGSAPPPFVNSPVRPRINENGSN